MAMVWVTNPVTLIPIYYFNWRVGRYFIETSTLKQPDQVQQQIQSISEKIGGISNLLSHLYEKAFWSELGRLVWVLGVELWLGSIIVGLAIAIPTYFLTRWGIRVYRHRVPRPILFKRSLRKARRDELRSARPQLKEPPTSPQP